MVSPVMEVDPAIDIMVHEGVYAPAEDSWLLLDALEIEDGRMLDMGTGTGVIGLHAARHGMKVDAVDVSPAAVDNARANACRNDIDIGVTRSDLFTGVDKRYDVIAFNPPYLPARDGDSRWDGGPNGIMVARRFLDSADGHLAQNGRIFLLLSSLGDISGLLQDFRERYRFERKRRLALFFERLTVYEVTRRGSGRAPMW